MPDKILTMSIGFPNGIEILFTILKNERAVRSFIVRAHSFLFETTQFIMDSPNLLLWIPLKSQLLVANSEGDQDVYELDASPTSLKMRCRAFDDAIHLSYRSWCLFDNDKIFCSPCNGSGILGLINQ